MRAHLDVNAPLCFASLRGLVELEHESGVAFDILREKLREQVVVLCGVCPFESADDLIGTRRDERCRLDGGRVVGTPLHDEREHDCDHAEKPTRLRHDSLPQRESSTTACRAVCNAPFARTARTSTVGQPQNLRLGQGACANVFASALHVRCSWSLSCTPQPSPMLSGVESGSGFMEERSWP